MAFHGCSRCSSEINLAFGVLLLWNWPVALGGVWSPYGRPHGRVIAMNTSEDFLGKSLWVKFLVCFVILEFYGHDVVDELYVAGHRAMPTLVKLIVVAL